MICPGCLEDSIYLEIDLGDNTHIKCKCGLDTILDAEDPSTDILVLAYDLEEARRDARRAFHEGKGLKSNPYKKDKSDRDKLLFIEWDGAWDVERRDQARLASSLSAKKEESSKKWVANEEVLRENRKLDRMVKRLIKENDWYQNLFFLLLSKNYV